MNVWQALFYIVAVILISLAAFGVTSPRVSLALLGAAFALLAYALPTIASL